MVKSVDHIGIAVSNLDEALKLYTDTFGLELQGTEVVEEQKVKVAFLPIGDTEIELLESTDPEGPIARFIEKRGQGIQHIACLLYTSWTERKSWAGLSPGISGRFRGSYPSSRTALPDLRSCIRRSTRTRVKPMS